MNSDDSIATPLKSNSNAQMHYRRLTTGHDEAINERGEIYSHWRYLLDSLQILGEQGLYDRQQKVHRILRDDGATYNLTREPLGSRTWGLDPVPLILSSDDWAGIELGLIERAELFNLILKDIYGPRDLIRRGIVPPEVIFAHRGFLRSCDKLRLPGEHQLVLHSCDLIRTTENEMCVINDRTQTPSGAGYALENRTVLSRVMPSLFRDSHVHRLSLFFHELRNRLQELSPNQDSPLIVVWTPGVSNENYFEHAYLANYLGYPLVRSDDLTVRDGYVWLKSLQGLRKVDVLLRRVDDEYCDPVELQSRDNCGISSLLSVARQGRVAVVNPLGTAVLENPALFRYLPAISQYFLGHEPRLKQVPSYWCGDRQDLGYVLEHLSQLVICPIFRRAGDSRIFGPQLSKKELELWHGRLSQQGMYYCAQEFVTPACAPAWQNEQLVPRAFLLRGFTVAGEHSYTVMPGGLTRVPVDESSVITPTQRQSVSKDTWVIASEPEKQISLWPTRSGSSSNEVDRNTEIPSRVVENFFWLGRYSERAETSLRLLRTVFMQFNGVQPPSSSVRHPLLCAVTQVTETYPGFNRDNPKLMDSPDEELLSIVLDSERPGSISSSILAMLNNAEEVKERFSSDIQRIINDIRDELQDMKQAFQYGLISAPEESLDGLVSLLLALSGLVQESMVRSYSWQFLEIGKRIERAQQTAIMLRALLSYAADDSDQQQLMETTLISTDSLITFRRRYSNQPELTNALKLLLLDTSNPRSLIFQFERLEQHFKRLPNRQKEFQLSPESRLLLDAKSKLMLADLSSLIQLDKKNQHRPEFDQLLVRLQNLMSQSSNAIRDQYFAHLAGPQQLINREWPQE